MQKLKMTPAKVAQARAMLVAGTPVKAISAKIKISIPTIYVYFPGGVRAIRKELERDSRKRKRAA